MKDSLPIIVFSHLRWDWVYQRPQHLISRLAAGRRVFFVEEPQHEPGGEARWNFSEPEPDVLVCRPLTPIASPGFSDEQMPVLHCLVRELRERAQLDEYVVWFYTPMALPLLAGLKPAGVVYDCMDELSAFRGAPPALLDREAALYGVADVVFTGGPSLYKAKRSRHHNVHCFPSSVDAAHFEKARGQAEEPRDQAALAGPRLGFFGVIDERLDLQLLDAMARAHPEWQICMVGPVIKIDPGILPRHANIHYFGQRPYEALPGYLKGWDVCLLPFARNEATRFISPTKTLEYMAAEKPIVSTPITDVAEPYGHIVRLGDDAATFIAACEQALSATPEDRTARTAEMRKVLAKTSWDSTARAMADQIEAVVAAGRTLSASSARQPAASSDESAGRVVVIGAGPTGLSAAYHLGSDALLLERNERVGGWCRSIEDGGFTFDYAGHIMFSNDPYVHELYEKLLGDNVHWQNREAWIFSKGVYTRYPFQGALYGLPPEVIKECIVGAIEARFGPIRKKASSGNSTASGNGNGREASLKIETQGATPAAGNGKVNGNNGHAPGSARTTNGHSRPLAETRSVASSCAAGDVKDCCADGLMESTARLGRPLNANGNGNGNGSDASGEPRNFEEFIYRVWGAGIAKHFAIPYNRKLWAVPLTEMETSWLGGRVPLPDLEEMIDGALQPVPAPMGPNARFGYPLRGGFQALMNGFLPHVQDRLRLNTAVKRVSPRRKTITTRDGEEIRYEYLISTMPLPVLIRSMGDEVPAAIRQAADGLRYVSVRCVNIAVGRENITDKHWIYYPEDTVFHRIFVQGNASPHCNRPGGFGFTCEITYSPHKPLPCDGQDLIQRCIDDCRRVGFIREDDPIWCANQVDMPHAYVVYDHGRSRNVKLIRDWLEKQDILLAGRYSEWEYYNSDHAFIAGKKAADQVRQLMAERTSREARAASGARTAPAKATAGTTT